MAQKMAWAQNAVITQDNGRSVRYRPRCPYCGLVNPVTECSGTASENIRSRTSAFCYDPKCHKRFDIVISRG